MAGLEAGLTRREAQAVKYVSRGFTNKQIAGSLGIKEDTVKKHLISVYAKVGVRPKRTHLCLHNNGDAYATSNRTVTYKQKGRIHCSR